MALQRIGARGTIASLQEDSPNAIKVLTVFDMIFEEVLSEREWKFAKTRVQLQQNAQGPAGGYRFAYALPSDFLRLCRPREIPEERRITYGYDLLWGWGGFGFGWFRHRDIPVWPSSVHPYVVEAVIVPPPPNPPQGFSPSYTTCLLSNYPHCADPTTVPPVIINYIRLITDFTQLFPGFVNALAFRLAAELAISITESESKHKTMMGMYLSALSGAQAQQECDDYLADESGNFNWLYAGRYWGCGRR